MVKSRRICPRHKHEQEAADELIGLLTAISIVSRRLAKNLTLLRAIKQNRGETQSDQTKHTFAHAD